METNNIESTVDDELFIVGNINVELEEFLKDSKVQARKYNDFVTNIREEIRNVG